MFNSILANCTDKYSLFLDEICPRKAIQLAKIPGSIVSCLTLHCPKGIAVILNGAHQPENFNEVCVSDMAVVRKSVALSQA